ncbi:hypothetical protein EVAR_36975_1 [Eumeta japonica]|uniref:Uncharacterized protein n=1 Tax=Eumeta variegata TaxID=151549 RepID=A0A4C1W8B4_EUMVA|nr:hypothetical protein EVAR_36975_1 [Eumeta japonica]
MAHRGEGQRNTNHLPTRKHPEVIGKYHVKDIVEFITRDDAAQSCVPIAPKGKRGLPRKVLTLNCNWLCERVQCVGRLGRTEKNQADPTVSLERFTVKT